MEQQIKPCPFCGCIPEANGDVVTHRHNGEICIVDDTQYDIEKWNKRADGWISVKDRLPENEQKIFAYDIKEGECLCQYDKDYSQFCNIYPACDGYEIDDLITQITHWMPLPEPPK